MSWIWAFVLGWIASFLASAFYGWGKRPVIEISTEPDPTPSIGQMPGHPKHRFFHLIVENKEAPFLWRRFTQRDTAWACEVSLSFYFADRPREKAIPDTVIARWSSAPELLQPVVLPNVSVGGQAARSTIPDLTKLPYGRRMDLHAGKPEPLDLVVKFEGQRQCYVFGNESYWLGWENEGWRLEGGEYSIVAEIRSGGYRKTRIFRLTNNGTQLDSVTVRSLAKRQP